MLVYQSAVVGPAGGPYVYMYMCYCYTDEEA